MFSWVPGHAGIHGNTKANAAVTAALYEVVKRLKLPYTDFKRNVSLYIRKLCKQSALCMSSCEDEHIA